MLKARDEGVAHVVEVAAVGRREVRLGGYVETKRLILGKGQGEYQAYFFDHRWLARHHGDSARPRRVIWPVRALDRAPTEVDGLHFARPKKFAKAWSDHVAKDHRQAQGLAKIHANSLKDAGSSRARSNGNRWGHHPRSTEGARGAPVETDQCVPRNAVVGRSSRPPPVGQLAALYDADPVGPLRGKSACEMLGHRLTQRRLVGTSAPE